MRVEYFDAAGKTVLNSAWNAVVLNSANVEVHRGTVTETETWSKDKVHIVVGRMNLKDGASVTVEAGTVVKFAKNSWINTENGTTLTVGDNTTFTRLEDDTVGGDTNLDGGNSVPQFGNAYIRGNGNFELGNVTMKFVTTTTSGTITQSETWYAGVYHVTGDLTVASGATLTLMPGVILKFDPGCQLTVNSGATLNAKGNNVQPIVFTSVKDDSYGGDTNEDENETEAAAGDWIGLWVYGLADMEHCILQYAGPSNERGLLQVSSNGIANLNSCTLTHAKYDGFWNWGGSIDSKNCIIYDVGLATAPYRGTQTFTNCTFDSVSYFAMYWSHWTGKAEYTNCIFNNILENWIDNQESNAYKNSLTFRNNVFGTQLAAFSEVGKNGNIWADPLFRDAANGDYHLMAGSPCIDAADGSVAPKTDKSGIQRVADIYSTPTGIADSDGNYADIGAFEFAEGTQGNIDLEIISAAGPQSVSIGDKVTISWTLKNNGTAAAKGVWTDSVYLVSEGGQKVLASNVSHSGNITSGDLQTFYAEVTIPQIASGNWYIAVEANTSRSLFEGSLIENNNIVSAAATFVDVPTLTFPTESITLPAKESKLYKVIIPANEEYYLVCNTVQDDKSDYKIIGLTARDGFVPTDTLYDWKSSTTVNGYTKTNESNWQDTLTQLYIPAADHERTVYLDITQLNGLDAAIFDIARISSDFSLKRVDMAVGSVDINDIPVSRTVSYASTVSVRVAGTGFKEGMTAALIPGLRTCFVPIYGNIMLKEAPERPVIYASKVNVISGCEAILTFEMPALGVHYDINDHYHLQLNLNGQSVQLENSIAALSERTTEYINQKYFSLNANLQIPDSVRAGRVYTGYINYSNRYMDSIAPLLIVQASSNVKLSLDPNSWEDASNSLQLLGIGNESEAGRLTTEDSGRIPFYFISSSDSATSDMYISLGCLTYKDEEACPDTTYFATWKEYHEALGQIQKGLAANGNTVLDCAQLQQLLLAWATDMVNPMGTLTSSLDSEVRNDSNSLTWERVYIGGMLEERFLDSEMGRGWYHNWDYSLTLEDNGNVLLEFPQGIAIVYQVQKTANGKTIYYIQADVHLDLVKETDGTWTLTSLDGSIYIFAADGTLSKITDPNGNIISMAYSEGKLASVTDFWGQSLTIERNAAGKITSVTESNGRRTVYTYDKTNTYLISAAWHDGRTVSYEYETAAGNTLSVLKTITFADGTHQYFTYDDLGRVYETHYDNGLGSVCYELGNTTADLLTYKVYFGSDLQGTVYLNSLGLTAKTVDAQGRTTVYLYDDKGQLIQSVAPDSTITSYTYDEWGNLLSVTDAAGSLLGYTYTETGDLSTLTDAAGNKTLFVYDQFGNMTSMQRADQTCTAYTYNDDGTVHTYTTRMGQTFVYSYTVSSRRITRNYMTAKVMLPSRSAKRSVWKAKRSLSPKLRSFLIPTNRSRRTSGKTPSTHSFRPLRSLKPLPVQTAVSLSCGAVTMHIPALRIMNSIFPETAASWNSFRVT